jgi:hypothetical protein
MAERKKPAKYVCDHVTHAWCANLRGVITCHHAKPHVAHKACTKEQQTCVCWGIEGPIAGREECIEKRCKRV